MSEINFVRQRVRQLTQAEARDKKIFRILAIVAGVLFLFFGGVFGYKLYLNSELEKVQTAQESYLQLISTQEEQEKSFVVFVHKIRTLAQIFETRQSKQAAIEYFSQVFGDEVTIARMAYDASSGLLAFSLQAKDVFTLNEVFSVIDSEQTLQSFSSLSKSGLQRSDTGTYQLQVSVLLGDQGGN